MSFNSTIDFIVPYSVPLHLVPAPHSNFTNSTKYPASKSSPSYPPLFTSSYLPATTIICLLLTWICSSAGIGGAALDSVVFILIMGLVPKQVSPLTKALVFGESLGGFLINVRRHHPFLKRPLINYEVALAFEPMSLLGTLWGVYANQSLPSYIILAGLILVLSFASYRTFYKGILLLRAERKQKKKVELSTTTEDKDKNKDGPKETTETVVSGEESGQKVYDCKWFLGQREGIEYFPWKISLFLFFNWVALMLFNVFVGTTAVGVTCGTTVYWGGMVGTIPVLFILAAMGGYLLHRRYLLRKKKGFEYQISDFKWTVKRVLLFQGASLATGVLAAMFGLGGGTLNSPLMLELGVIPAQVPATSGLMILLTSSVAIIQYLALGKINYDYLLWFMMIGFFGGISGHLGIRYYIKRYNKQSMIVFLLATLVFAGLCVLVYTVSLLFITKTAQMGVVTPC